MIGVKKETEPYIRMTKLLEDFAEALTDQRKLRRCLAQRMSGSGNLRLSFFEMPSLIISRSELLL